MSKHGTHGQNYIPFKCKAYYLVKSFFPSAIIGKNKLDPFFFEFM